MSFSISALSGVLPLAFDTCWTPCENVFTATVAQFQVALDTSPNDPPPSFSWVSTELQEICDHRVQVQSVIF